ncbi:MAG: NAD(P)/FAD-dependent oxidoreductase [Nostoc sp. S4]|nr:NAD(P)/FAD-dependent oxidoreductase [Nostoc sp. S4]
MLIKQVCVIGAGISGLVAAKTFIEEGYEVTVFEKQKSLGGVWEKSRTYPGLTIQNTRDTYAFSDYPMPASYPEWPTAEQMQKYLESYAQHFGVMEKIRFHTEVTKVEQKTDGTGWVVSVNTLADSEINTTSQKYEFDFVLVCNGIFNIPHQPSLAGKEEFIASGGQLLHSTQFNDISAIAGKRVIVVGFGKSAVDIATTAAPVAAECTLVFRQASWKIPRFFFGVLNMKYVLLSRFAEAWLPYRHLQGIERLLHTVGKPLVWLYWRVCEMLLGLHLDVHAFEMQPSKPLNQSLDCGGISVLPPNFRKHLRSGKIRTFKTAIARLMPGGVELATGEHLPADIVILATGFRQDIPFLEEKYHQLIIDNQNIFHLYRHLIHPDIPQMGFVGYNSSFYCQLTSEIGARWLAEYVKGNLVLPSNSAMYDEMATEWQWSKTYWNYIDNNGTCIAPFHLHHIEQLINDMGVKSHKKFWQKIPQVLMPLDPSIYKNILQQLS